MIRTLLGDIERNEVTGNILAHEHIMVASGEMLFTQGRDWLDLDWLEERAVEVYSEVKRRFGVSLVIDGTPCDLGRDLSLIKRVSARSGVHFVASSGLYYYPSQLTCKRTAEELAEIFIGEAKKGVGAEKIRIGALKCAVDADGFTPDCKKRVRALAITQRETRLPLYAHCRFVGDSAHELLDIMESERVELSSVLLGHATNRLDADYLESLLNRGCYLGFDQCFSGGEGRCAEVVAELCRRGYEDRLVFSHDYAIYNDFESASRTGRETSAERSIERLGFLFTRMLTGFREAGCSDAQCRKFTVLNPLGFLDKNIL